MAHSEYLRTSILIRSCSVYSGKASLSICSGKSDCSVSFLTDVLNSQHKVVILPNYRVAIISRMLYNNITEVTNMELVRKQTYITPAQDRAVKRLAQQQGTTEAEILRKALDLLLAREGIGENEDPFADLIGSFSGPSEVDHDDIYR